MDNQPPISSPTGAPLPPPPSSNAVDLPVLVQAQKWVLLAVLANIVVVLLTLVVATHTREIIAAASSVRHVEAAHGIVALFNVLRLLTAIGTALAIWNLARSLRYNLPWLPAILSLFPCIGLITLLVLNSRATTELQLNGYHVGLMGAKRRDS